MSNVNQGDIAYYTGPSEEIGPVNGQFCKVLGPAKPAYRLMGCCGAHWLLIGAGLADKLIWEVEWSNVVDFGDGPGGPLSLKIGSCLDAHLRRIDGGITEKDIAHEIELDKQSAREAEVASGARAEFAWGSFGWWGAMLSLCVSAFVDLLRAVGNLIIGNSFSGGAKPRRADAHVRVEPRMKGEA